MRLDDPFSLQRVDGPGPGRGYLPEADHLGLGREFTEIVEDWARRALEDPKSTAFNNIPVLVSTAGHGKTHLLARVHHRLRERCLTFFVPAIEDPRRPMDHLRRYIVGDLFHREGDGPSQLESQLARLLQPSFVQYVKDLPRIVRLRLGGIEKRIAADSLAVRPLFEQVRDVRAFRALAESIAGRYPEVPVVVLHALLLAFSPQRDSARRWLRGESLSEAAMQRCGIDVLEPPSPLAVIEAMAGLFAKHSPLIVLLDQIENVLVGDLEENALALGRDLMQLLSGVPNLLVCLSCLESSWDAFRDNTFESMRQRMTPTVLRALEGDDAVELLRRRLSLWTEDRDASDPSWPFDTPNVHEFASRGSFGARLFFQHCRDAFGIWRQSDRQGLARLGEHGSPMAEVSLMDVWSQALDEVRRDPRRQPTELAEERISNAFHLAASIESRKGGRLEHAVLERDVLASTSHQRRHSLLTTRGERSTLLCITKLDNGTSFRHYWAACEKHSIATEGLRVVLAYPGPGLKVGQKTEQAMQVRAARGTLRHLDLQEHTEATVALEAAQHLATEAVSGELWAGSRQVTRDEWESWLAQSGVLGELSIWGAIDPASQADQAQRELGEVTTGGRSVRSLAPSKQDTRGAGTPLSTTEHQAQDALRRLVETLESFSLAVEALEYSIGPSFFRLKIMPVSKTRFAAIQRAAEDLRVHLALPAVPIIQVQAGHVSVDFPREPREFINIGECRDPWGPRARGRGRFCVGVDVEGESHWLDLADSSDCHLLIGGTTGSGKSAFLRSMLYGLSCNNSPEELQVVLVDPKRVTFQGILAQSPFVRGEVLHGVAGCPELLEALATECEERFDLLESRMLQGFEELPREIRPPRIIAIFDEFAELVVEKKHKQALETTLRRLGAKARAAGIHLVLATQRPEASVVTPILRSNLPGRIAFRVATAADSSIVLGSSEDAAKLFGSGDLLWKRVHGYERLQAPFVSDADFVEALGVSAQVPGERD